MMKSFAKTLFQGFAVSVAIVTLVMAAEFKQSLQAMVPEAQASSEAAKEIRQERKESKLDRKERLAERRERRKARREGRIEN